MACTHNNAGFAESNGVWLGFGFSNNPELTTKKRNQAATAKQPKAARYIPKTLILEKNSNLIYLIDNYFDKKTTRMFYKDETLKIKWPKIKKITIADSDQNATSLKDLKY